MNTEVRCSVSNVSKNMGNAGCSRHVKINVEGLFDLAIPCGQGKCCPYEVLPCSHQKLPLDTNTSDQHRRVLLCTGVLEP